MENITSEVMEMREIRFVLKKLKEVQDPRQLWKIRHSLVDILAISIIAVMCGAQSSHQIHLFAQVREAWFRRFLALPNGIRSVY